MVRLCNCKHTTKMKMENFSFHLSFPRASFPIVSAMTLSGYSGGESFAPAPFIPSCTIQSHRSCIIRSLLNHSSSPVPFNSKCSCTSLDVLCSRGPAQVVTFQLGSNSGLLLRIPQLCPWTLGRTRPSVQDIAVSCVGTQKALYP